MFLFLLVAVAKPDVKDMAFTEIVNKLPIHTPTDNTHDDIRSLLSQPDRTLKRLSEVGSDV